MTEPHASGDWRVRRIEAHRLLREVTDRLDPFHRRTIFDELDRGLVYEHVLQGWDDYLATAGNLKPTEYRLIMRLLSQGTPSHTGCIVVADPGPGPRLQKLLGVGYGAAKSLLRWIDGCPLILPHPDLEKHLRIFGRVEDLPQGDAHRQFSLGLGASDDGRPPDDTPPSPSPPGASAPGGVFSSGAIAPDGLTSSGAIAPDRERGPGAIAPGSGRDRARSGAQPRPMTGRDRARWESESGAIAPDLPPDRPKSGAIAPDLPAPLLGRKVGRYLNPTYLPSSTPAPENSAPSGRGPKKLPAPDLAEPDPDLWHELDRRQIFGPALEALSRCSQLTPKIIRDVDERRREQGAGPGALMVRLGQRVDQLRRQEARRGRAASPPPAGPADNRNVADALAELDRLEAEGGEA